MTDETPVQTPDNGRRRSTSAMLTPTTDAEPTQCKAKATGAGSSLAMMATLGFLWGGACFGFNGIKTVFLDEGLFADACDHGDRCKAQINQVDAAWTFASAMLNVMALVNGSLSDALGLRRLCLLSSALLAISTVMFYLVVTRRRYEQYLSYVYFALVESGMLLSFGGLALQGEKGSLTPPCSRPYDVRVVAAPTMETAFALGTLIFPTLRLIHDGVRGANLVTLYCSYFAACSVLILYCACRTKARPLRRPGSGALRHVGWRRLLFAFCAALAVGANITQQGFYVATRVESKCRPRPNHGLHAIDATPARWRGDVGSSPRDGASSAASSSRNGTRHTRLFPHRWRRSRSRRGGTAGPNSWVMCWTGASRSWRCRRCTVRRGSRPCGNQPVS